MQKSLKINGVTSSDHEVIANSELNQLRRSFDAERLHHFVFVEGYCSGRYREDISGLFHCFSFGQ